MDKDPVCGMPVDERTEFIAECGDRTYRFCSAGCREKFFRERSNATARDSYDLIIIGGGPAGLTAAVYAATLRIDACLISSKLGGQEIDSTRVENYMGFDFITGPDLVEKFRSQLVHSHYLDHLIAEVNTVEPATGGFLVRTSTELVYKTRTLIIATGMTRRRLGIPGEEEFQRRGIFYGNVPDLTFVQGEDAAVIGGGNSALQMVESLQGVARRIYLISNSELKGDPAVIERVSRIPNLHRYEGYETLEFCGDRSLRWVSIREREEDGSIIAIRVRGAFIAIGQQPNASLVSSLVEMNTRGEIIIGPDCSTSCPGLFAAGDVTDAYGKRIIIAAGEGAKAAIAAREYLLNLERKKRKS